MATLDDIRKKLLAQTQKNERSGQTGNGDKTVYPFWNLPDNATSEVRFLPDGNPNNTFFWQERLVIKLPFQGIVGQGDQEVFVTVPCMEMYGEKDYIIEEIRDWWKDDDLVDTARKYYKKKSYIFQGFVVKDGMEEKDSPENPIRRFVINPSIFNLIKASLMDPEMEDLPTDYDNGRDFRLIKTVKGKYADYTTSKWSMKTRPLSDAERAAISQYGLNDLSSFLPQKPTTEQLEAIKEMFSASVEGLPYDPAKWSNYYKPGTLRSSSDNDDVVTPATRSAPTTTVAVPKPTAPIAALNTLKEQVAAEEPATVVKVETVSAEKPNAQKILEMIKKNKQQG